MKNPLMHNFPCPWFSRLPPCTCKIMSAENISLRARNADGRKKTNVYSQFMAVITSDSGKGHMSGFERPSDRIVIISFPMCGNMPSSGEY